MHFVLIGPSELYTVGPISQAIHHFKQRIMTTTVPEVNVAAAPLLRPGTILHAHLFDNVVLTTRILTSTSLGGRRQLDIEFGGADVTTRVTC